MQNAFQMPSDLPLLSSFRLLSGALGASKAYHAVYLIFQELFFRAQEGAPRGRVPAAYVPALVKSLSEVDPAGDEVLKLAAAPGGLLERDGEDYVCPRFIVLNSQVGVGSIAVKGANRKAFLSRQRKLHDSAFEQSLLIRPDVFVDGDGKKLDAEQVRRVTRLIISCDNALYKPERLPHEYGEGLIQAALRVLAKFEDDEINLMINRISLFRDHPALNGMNAEKLLPAISETVGRLT